MALRQVITALNKDGTDMLGRSNLALKLVDETSIVSGSLLTVESNHFCILKSRGAVLNVYDAGQYALTTPDKPIVGSIVQGFWGSSPWVYEVIYVNRAKLLVRTEGTATTAEMAEVRYQADYYIHVDTKEDALALITHLPFTGPVINTEEISAYAGPAIGQSINQVIQVTKLENINEHINELRELVKEHLAAFLREYGVKLNDLKILVTPKDPRMRELISLQALGLNPIDAVRYYLALQMAERGLISAPNAAVGSAFAIGGQAFVAAPLATAAAGGTPARMDGAIEAAPGPGAPNPWR